MENLHAAKPEGAFMDSFLRALSYPRGVLLLVFGVIHTFIAAAVVLTGTTLLRSRRFDDWVTGTFWPRPILKACHLDIEVRGGRDLPKTGFLYLFNHTSYLDILVMFGHLPRPFRFGAKIELFSIPLFGGAMRRLGILPIARNNRSKVLNIYKEAEARVANGEAFALAPEGTRQDGYQLGRFKSGPFIFAISAQMPVVPVVMAGVAPAMPKGKWLLNTGAWRRKILVDVLPPISTEGLTMDDLSSLQDRTREQMAQAYAKLNRELGLS